MNSYLRTIRVTGPDVERVARAILESEIEPDGCWHWTRSTTKTGGYARTYYGGRDQRAHRMSYLFWVGDLDPKLVIDHLCCHTWCVNPHHLEQVTVTVNNNRAQPLTTHCHRGHERTPENTKFNSAGKRLCLACCAIHDQKKRARYKAQGLTTGGTPFKHPARVLPSTSTWVLRRDRPSWHPDNCGHDCCWERR